MLEPVPPPADYFAWIKNFELEFDVRLTANFTCHGKPKGTTAADLEDMLSKLVIDENYRKATPSCNGAEAMTDDPADDQDGTYGLLHAKPTGECDMKRLLNAYENALFDVFTLHRDEHKPPQSAQAKESIEKAWSLRCKVRAKCSGTDKVQSARCLAEVAARYYASDAEAHFGIRLSKEKVKGAIIDEDDDTKSIVTTPESFKQNRRPSAPDGYTTPILRRTPIGQPQPSGKVTPSTQPTPCGQSTPTCGPAATVIARRRHSLTAGASPAETVTGSVSISSPVAAVVARHRKNLALGSTPLSPAVYNADVASVVSYSCTKITHSGTGKAVEDSISSRVKTNSRTFPATPTVPSPLAR